MEPLEYVIECVRHERARQDILFRDAMETNDHETWLLVAMEELGEVAKSMLERKHVPAYEEIIQTAAVMVAWGESMIARSNVAKTK